MKPVIALLITLFPYLLHCQDSTRYKNVFVDLNGYYGFIVPHHNNMEYLIKRHITAGELNLLIQGNGEKRWEQLYKNPEKGIGFYYAGLGNPEALGAGLGIYPFINFPLNPGRKIKLYLRSADGVGFITKPYDRLTNHKNNINGSIINAFVNIRLNTVFYPTKNLRMETGIGLTHISNGSFATPNLGINIVAANLSMSILTNKIPFTVIPPSQLPRDTIKHRKYFVTIIAAAGFNENSPPDGKKYPVFSIYPSVWKTLSEKSRICLGADAFYEFANIYSAQKDSIYDTSKPVNTLQAGIRIGYELVISKFSLPVEMGVYTFSKMKYLGSMYHRIGIRYQASKHIIINYSLRTHWATAEHIEVGLGYKF